MRNSIFKKYLLLTSCIMLLSFLVMGSVMYVSMSNYWIEDKLAALEKTATFSSHAAARQISKTENNAYQISGDAQIMFMLQDQTLDADIFIAKTSGEVLLSSNLTDNSFVGKQVPESAVQAALQGTYTDISNLGGLYADKQYVVGVPLVYSDADTGTSAAIGAVFVTSTARSMTAFRRDIVQMCIISAIFASAVSFILSGAMTYRMVLPLREMSAAAASFAKGDFSQRVRVRSKDEVGELAEAFNNMATSLSASENMNRSFVANVSHELKTPMTTISGFIDGILDGTIPPEKQDYYLKIVSSEVKRLSRLVRSMLDLSRIDSGKMQLHRIRFDIRDTVVDTMLSFESLIDQRHIHIEGLEDCESVFVDGDPDLIHQVVYNLVENAVKFVDDSGTISVAISHAENDVAVRIRNTGAGIAPEEQPLVFGRFYKTDKSRSHDKNGMGLGLYLVRTIIQMHGGEISLNSVEGEFCEFEFHLPIEPAVPAEQV
ncbi:MAG: HAMP domain-containing sensor histidine kinase [Firmicutes bacterium]|nr:HAMP domain-containing sensor histidine kinase [Bacillota bacterium]